MELKVIMDHRERNEEIIRGLEKREVEIEKKVLDVGDYIISDRIGLERKSIHDLEGSIIDGRLFEQISRLKESYGMPILLIEGNSEEFEMSNKVIIGAVMALYIDYGIQSVFSNDAEETSEIIYRLAKHEQQKEKREISLKKGSKAYSAYDSQRMVIGNLPGVGPKLSKLLLNHFGSIKSIANANVEEFMNIDKIGKKKAEKIYEIINKRFDISEYRNND